MPANQDHKPNDAPRAKAIDRAPTCIGTTAIAIPISIGSTAPNTSSTLKKVKNWPMLSSAKSWNESESIRSKPRSTPITTDSNAPAEAKMMKSRPIFLWSVDVNQSATASNVAAAPPLPATLPDEFAPACVSMVVICAKLPLCPEGSS